MTVLSCLFMDIILFWRIEIRTPVCKNLRKIHASFIKYCLKDELIFCWFLHPRTKLACVRLGIDVC